MLRVIVTSHDRWRDLTWFAISGLGIATVLGAFGMPPVDLHGPLHYLGIMGPLCGMTRGVAAAIRGDLAGALSYNPASLLLIPGAALVLVRAVLGRATGRWIDAAIVRRRRVLALVLAVVAALTVNQQLHASLLMGP